MIDEFYSFILPTSIVVHKYSGILSDDNRDTRSRGKMNNRVRVTSFLFFFVLIRSYSEECSFCICNTRSTRTKKLTPTVGERYLGILNNDMTSLSTFARRLIS